MYEIHGWIKLVESPSDMDETELEKKCDQLSSLLTGMEWPSGKCELLTLNGCYMLVVNAIPNRRRSEADELNTLIEFVVKEFKGAYGIIYEYDEQLEAPNGHGIFSVRVIKRGSCENRLDPFLSPAIPTVEDP